MAGRIEGRTKIVPWLCYIALQLLRHGLLGVMCRAHVVDQILINNIYLRKNIDSLVHYFQPFFEEEFCQELHEEERVEKKTGFSLHLSHCFTIKCLKQGCAGVRKFVCCFFFLQEKFQMHNFITAQTKAYPQHRTNCRTSCLHLSCSLLFTS